MVSRALLVARSAAAALVALSTATAAFSAPDAAQQTGGQAQLFAFGLWGDVPYARSSDTPKIPSLIQDMNAAHLAFSVFDGDIKDGSSECADAEYAAARDRFNSFEAPMVYVPGDNEWTDCHPLNNGGYNNLERLDYIRQTLFASPNSFGRRTLALEHQAAPYIENTRWVFNTIVFVGLNVPGSNNNKVNTAQDCTDRSARTQEDCDADNAEYAARDAANTDWMHQAFQLAQDRRAPGIVLVMQADPSFDPPETPDVDERADPAFDGYTSFLDALVAETQAYPGQVVLVHGDTHFFKLDKPLSDQAHLVPNLTRLETFGSPNVHWVRADVDPASRAVFSFTPMLVPGN